MKFPVLALAFCLLTSSLSAQWTDDTDVNTLAASAITGDLQSIGTSDGKTYIAFWHDVPAPRYYEIRLQLLDADGNKLFGPDGMLLNSAVEMSSFTTTWSMNIDRDNNVYVAFNGTGADNKVYVNKVSPAGVQLWGDAGVNPGTGYDAKVLPIEGNETIITWLPGNKAAMQKIAADGTLLWANPITIEPGIANHKSSAGELAALSNGDYVVIIHDRGGFSPSALPFAQRYTNAGAAVWAAPVALTSNYYTAFNRRYNLRQDGDVLYFGYAGAQGIEPHVFLQRINPDGSLPWGINGSDFSTQTALFEADAKIAFAKGSNAIWAICTYTDAAQGSAGEYVQKFNKNTGVRLLGNEGKLLFPVAADYISHQGDLQLVNDQPIFLISNGNSNGVFPKDLLAVKLDASGNFEWAGQTHDAATNPTGVKSRIQFNTSYNGQVVAVWAENRNNAGSSLPYAQRVQVTCAPPTAGFEYASSGLEAIFNTTAVDPTFSYLWTFGDGSSSSEPSPFHTYAGPATYQVCHYVSNQCGTDTLCQTLTIQQSSVSTLIGKYNLTVSPNPTQGDCALSLDLPASTELSYRLLDATGRLLKTQTANLSSGRQTLPIQTGLAPGAYILQVTVEGNSASLPFIVN